MEKEYPAGNFNQSLRDRTMKLAVMVLGLLRAKKIDMLSRPMVTQLVRSSTSVAANCRAATRARSDAEFYAKICIVTEECDETQFWIELLTTSGFVTPQETEMLRREVDELVRIFTAIKKKMKDRLEREREKS